MDFQVGILMDDLETREYLASQWGKKGTTSDISLYSVSSKDITQTTIVPEGYPKKPLSLIISAHMSDILILGMPISGVNQNIGEAAILADCMGLPGLILIVGENTKGMDTYFDQVNKIFSKLEIKNWGNFVVHDGLSSNNVREMIKKLAMKIERRTEDYLAIEVDHSFPVQGVGSVILGTIMSGEIKKGDKIKSLPNKQEGIVRSIQVNDQDVNEASAGTHVGLAIKGILPKYLERGTVISTINQEFVYENNILKVKLKLSKFEQSIEVGNKIHLICGLFDSPGKIVELGDVVIIETEKMMPLHPNIRITVLDLNRKPSIIGSGYLN